MADITYCVTPECPFKDCERHCDNAPRGVPVSIAHMAGTCRRYIGYLVEEIERSKSNGTD